MSEDHLVPEDDLEILDAFIELVDNVFPDDPDEINEILKEAGLDPRQVAIEGVELISSLRSKTSLDWRNNLGDIEDAKRKFSFAGRQLPSDRTGLIDLFEQLLSKPAAKKIHAHYREHNPDKLSDDELRSFIHDLSFILDTHYEDSDKDPDT